jgi:hypothetical protein
MPFKIESPRRSAISCGNRQPPVLFPHIERIVWMEPKKKLALKQRSENRTARQGTLIVLQ